MTHSRVRQAIRRCLPSWAGELRNPETLRADLMAGIAVAMVLIPQSMAYANLAGLKPIHGLYAGLLPVVISALFGSCRLMVSGPAAVMCLMNAAALGPMGLDYPTYVGYSLLIALMVGVFQLALGYLRLGVLVDFVSHPVVTGFVNAAAVIIATSQVPRLFGVQIGETSNLAAKVWSICVHSATGTHLPTLAMTALSFTVLVGLRRWKPQFPTVLAAVVVATLVSWLVGFSAAGGEVVGTIPRGLPGFRLPSFSSEAILRLIGPAITIALIGIMSAVSIAKVIALRTRQPFDPNRELIGQGLGNVTASMFQGCVVAGSFARSAVNWSSGARTPFSSVVTGAVVALTLVFFTPLLYHLPMAVLSVITINAVTKLIQIEPIRRAWQAQKHCAIVSVATFLATLVASPHLEYGMLVGVVLSIGLYLSRTMRPRFAELGIHLDGTMRDAAVHGLTVCPYVAVCRFDGSLFFANVGHFEAQMLNILAGRASLRYLVLDARGINHVDASGLDAIEGLHEQLQKLGIELFITRVKLQVMEVFQRTGFGKKLGADHFLPRSLTAARLATDRLCGTCPESCPLQQPQATPNPDGRNVCNRPDCPAYQPRS